MKVIIFSDIHFGSSGDNELHNQRCLDFIKFMIDYNKENLENKAPIIFCGDWFNCRKQTNNKTLDMALEGLKLLDNASPAEKYVIVGNHDLYYSNKRDVSPIISLDNTSYTIIKDPVKLDIGGHVCLLCPWLTEDESLSGLIKKHKPEYVFGHFELPSFWLNRVVQKEGELDWKDYTSCKRIVSGHYHMRQERNNILYIGNCFGLNFSDENDWMHKGFGVLDLDTNTVEFVEWTDAPKYLKINLSDLASVMPLLNDRIHLKIVNNLGSTPSQLNEVLSVLKEKYNVSDAVFVSQQLQEENQSVEKMEHISDINVLITSLISAMTFEHLSNDRLISIYQNLEN